MDTRMLASPTDHRNHDQNLSQWSHPGGDSPTSNPRVRHRTTQTIVTVDERPPAGTGDLDLHTPMLAPDPLDRLHRGSIEFRIRPARMLDRAVRAPRSLEFSVVIAEADMLGPSHGTALRWNLDARSDDFGEVWTQTGIPDAPWRTRCVITPDHGWHEFQFSLDPRNFSSWLAIDRRPIDSDVVLAPATVDDRSGLTVRLCAFDRPPPPSDDLAAFAFRNWETASPNHRRWDGG